MAIIKLTNQNANIITAGTFADARLSSSSVSQHATSFDDNKIVNDISTLAIRQSSNENKGAYNSNSMSVDVFQDNTGVGTETNTDRNVDGEYVSSVVVTSVSSDAGGSTTDITSGNTYFSSGAARDIYGTGNDLGNNASNDYSYFSQTALLTGNFRFGYGGTSRSETTNTSLSDAGNYQEFGVTTFQGSSSNGTTGGVQANATLSNNTNSPSSTSATAPYIYASTGGYNQIILIIKKQGSTRTLLATIAAGNWATDANLAFVRSGSNLSFQINEVTKYEVPNSEFNTTANLYFMFGLGVGTSTFTDCQYRSGMSAIKGTSTQSVSATGNLISNAITAP